VGVSQTAAFNRGRHLYSAGRPSGWALAHISSIFVLFLLFFIPRLMSAVAGLKCAASGSLKMQDQKNRHKFAIWAPPHNFVGLNLRN